MDLTLPDSDKYLYHYCQLSTAIELILPKKRLKLGLLKNTNDPRENKGFIFTHFSKSNDEHLDIPIIDKNNMVNKKLMSNCKVLCFSTSNSVFHGFQLSNMWAHYGGNHKGVCIELNKDIFIKENQKFINDNFRTITYRNPEIQKFPGKVIDTYKLLKENSYFLKYRNDNKEFLYFTKTKEWEHEQEMRLIYFSKKRSDEYCKIKKSLSRVFVGVDFNEVYVDSLRRLMGNNCLIGKLEYIHEQIALRKYL
jgi:hypothetical protein